MSYLNTLDWLNICCSYFNFFSVGSNIAFTKEMTTCCIFSWLDLCIGSEPHISVLEHQAIHIYKMVWLRLLFEDECIGSCKFLIENFCFFGQPEWPKIPRSFPEIFRPLFLILKPIFQFLLLLWYLCVKIPAPDAFIVQVSFISCLFVSDFAFGLLMLIIYGNLYCSHLTFYTCPDSRWSWFFWRVIIKLHEAYHGKCSSHLPFLYLLGLFNFLLD